MTFLFILRTGVVDFYQFYEQSRKEMKLRLQNTINEHNINNKTIKY